MYKAGNNMIPISIGTEIAKGAMHWVARAVSVVVVLAIVIGIPFFAYQKGITKGYSTCAKDRPTYGNIAGDVYQCDPKDIPITLIRLWKIGLNWHRK